MNRREACALGLGVAVNTAVMHSTRAQAQQQPPVLALPADLTRNIVRVAHFDLQSVKAALERTPRLANACWDWGGGDFETPLGAASHVGRRDIAEALIATGARGDVFSSIVLGDLDVLRQQLQRRPSLVFTKGPHGLTFESHARATGDSEVERIVAEILAEARAALK
jgi:hypothetical protein